MFWGAPLVAGELESGTFRLAWTQDVSRVRWLALWTAPGTLEALIPGRMQGRDGTTEIPRGAA
jgi:hypothetical protein